MTSRTSPEPHIEGAKRRLVHLAGLSGRTEEAERKIMEAAEDRLTAIDADLSKLRARVNLDGNVADRYQALTLERGQCVLVVERAKQVLSA